MARVETDATAGSPPEDLERAFVRLFKSYYRPVYSFFLRRGFSAEASKDLAQDTFTHAYRAMPGLRDETGMGNWIFSIARNLWRNELRDLSAQKRRGVELSLDGLLDVANFSSLAEDGEFSEQHAASHLESGSQEPEMPERLLLDERVRALRVALEGLPPQMRLVVVLRVDQGLKYREIAELLKLSLSTVKSQLFQAKERLRDSLVDHFSEIEF